jgi:hypothetical protein
MSVSVGFALAATWLTLFTAVSRPTTAAAQPGTRAPETRPAAAAPAPPAFRAGAIVTDRTGARLGPIQSVADAPRGPMVVIEIEGKLVSVPQSTLTLKPDASVSSSQTRSEITSAAGARPAG